MANTFVPVGTDRTAMTLGDIKPNEDFIASTIQFLTPGGATAKVTVEGLGNVKAIYSYGVDTYSSGDTLYAVLLYTTTQDAKDYWMGNYGTITLESSQDQTVSGLGLTLGGAGTTATAWSTAAVPEPTSGLLLLLGMAGLALKRKRA